jgi:hypothetical protein
VEFVVAVTFVGLAYFDVYLPATETNEVSPETHLAISAFSFGAHSWLACSVLAAALIRWDGMRVPWKLIVPAIVVAAVAAPLVASTSRWLLLGMALVVLLVAVVHATKKPPTSAGG